MSLNDHPVLNDHPAVLWRRSRACNPVECVEVAFCEDRVLVRDSMNPGAGVLGFTGAEWQAFLFDLSRGRWPAPGQLVAQSDK